MSEGLFKSLNDNFKPQYNETIKPLQFHKLSRQANKSTEEWIGKLIIATTDCNYKKTDRQIKKQFIHGLNDTDMSTEIRAHKNIRK